MNPKIQDLLSKITEAGIEVATRGNGNTKNESQAAEKASENQPTPATVPAPAQVSAPGAPANATLDPQKMTLSDTEVARAKDEDPFLIKNQLEKYTNHLIELRKNYANRLFFLLAAEVAMVFAGMFLYGIGVFSFDPAVITIFANAVIIQTFFSVRVIVRNLYPEKSFVETLSILTNK